jgi:hypothetical protein
VFFFITKNFVLFKQSFLINIKIKKNLILNNFAKKKIQQRVLGCRRLPSNKTTPSQEMQKLLLIAALLILLLASSASAGGPHDQTIFNPNPGPIVWPD